VLVYASLLIPPASLAGAKRISQARSAILNPLTARRDPLDFVFILL
jgi:hypothetical protein